MKVSERGLRWKELSRELDYQKYGRKIEKVIFELPNGEKSDFYIKQEGPVACVLALTAKNEVVLFEQFRPGPMKSLKELPGGYIEPGEESKAAVARELIEETGYQGNIQFAGICLDDAYSTIERHCFVATDCVKIADPKHDPGEFGRPVLVSLLEFRKLLRTGQMTDVEVGYLCLDFLGLL